MFKFEFKVKTSTVQKYTLMLSAVCLVLTFLNLVNAINYMGVTYVIGAILLGKIDQLKYALSISGTGCILDFFYLIFHCSDSDWVFVRFVEFLLHFLVFLYEVMWIVSVYCYLKQRQEMLRIKEKVTWIEKQMNRFEFNRGSDKSTDPGAAAVQPSTSAQEPLGDSRATNVPATAASADAPRLDALAGSVASPADSVPEASPAAAEDDTTATAAEKTDVDANEDPVEPADSENPKSENP